MGKVKVSDMIKSNVDVDKSGKVTGSINYISGDDVSEAGHWFPIKISTKLYGKQLHVGGRVIDGEFVAGKDFTFTEEDPFLCICVEHCTDGNKVSIYDGETKTEMFLLDFNEATLEPPVGKYAVIVPEQGRDYGSFGTTAEYISDDVKIEWRGVNGMVTGHIKYDESNGKFSPPDNKGHYYPIILDSWYADKNVTVNGKVGKDTEWIFCLNNIMKGSKQVPILYEQQTIAVLDFSNATLEQMKKIKGEKIPVMNVPDFSEEELPFTDDNEPEKRYTKSEINLMNKADLQELATKKGIKNAYEMTGTDLKALLIEMLVNKKD